MVILDFLVAKVLMQCSYATWFYYVGFDAISHDLEHLSYICAYPKKESCDY